jgi:predicted acyl esterase
VADRIKPCDADSHTAHGYDTSPDYDDFWLQRDYLKDAAAFRVPVLVAHGWQDYNVKQEEGHRLYEALPVDDPATPAPEGVPWKGFYFWQAPHAAPGGEEWSSLLDAFFGKYLLGLDSGLERVPSVWTQGRDHAQSGALEGLASWPPPTTGEIELALGRSAEGGTLGVPGGEPASYTDFPGSSEEAAAEDMGSEQSWLAYRSEPLPADARIAGEPLLDATVSLSRDNGHLVPTLFDVDPGGAAVPISRGFLNLRYKDGLGRETPAPVGTPTRAVVTFKPQDWTVRAGHRIALVLQSSNPAWAVPAQPGLGVTVEHGGMSRLVLPVVGAAASAQAGQPQPQPPVPGARASTRPVPSRAQAARLSVRMRARGRRLIVTGRSVAGIDVKVTIKRGRRTTVRRTVRAGSAGAFRLVAKVRRRGTYRATAVVRSRDGLVSRRSKPVRVRRPAR